MGSTKTMCLLFIMVLTTNALISDNNPNNIKIFGVGLSKTGTSSMSESMKQLGLSTIHHDRTLLPFLYSNYSFERSYDDVDSVFDLPTAAYYEELLHVYPNNSLFILTVRDEQKWWVSFEKYYASLVTIYGGWLPFRQQHIITDTYGSLTPNEELWRAHYRAHNARVQKIIPANRLLVLNIADDNNTWSTLCPFLLKWGFFPSATPDDNACIAWQSGLALTAFPREYSHDRVEEMVARSELYQMCHPTPSPSPSSSSASMSSRYAYVLYAADVSDPLRRPYFLSALVLANSLMATGTTADIVMLTLGHVDQHDLELIQAMGLVHKVAHPVGLSSESTAWEGGDDEDTQIIRRARLRALLMVEYDVIVVLEADTFVEQNIDFLFEEFNANANASVMFITDDDTRAPFSTIFFVARPNCQYFISILDVARSNTFSYSHGWMKYGLIPDWTAVNTTTQAPLRDWRFPYASSDAGLLYYYYVLYTQTALMVPFGALTHFMASVPRVWALPSETEVPATEVGKLWLEGLERVKKFASEYVRGYDVITSSPTWVSHDARVHHTPFLGKPSSSSAAEPQHTPSASPLPLAQYAHLYKKGRVEVLEVTEIFDPYMGGGGTCQVSAWGDWTACSARCGSGTTSRSRSVTQQGSGCPQLSQSQSCNNEPCSWSESAAIRLLQFAYASYCDASSLQAWDCTHCVESGFQVSAVLSDSSWNTYGFVGYSSAKNEIIVSFRGTEEDSLDNWVEDLKFFKSWDPFDGLSECYVASGFNGAYSSLRSQTQTAVQNALQQNPSASVTVTGHSLGGAMSTLAVVDLLTNGYIRDATHYTYGSPRVGDSAFASAYEGMITEGQRYRVVNNDDIVPHVPFEDMGFTHVANEVWLHNGAITICDNSGEDPSCSDSLAVWDELSISDHLNYFGINNAC